LCGLVRVVRVLKKGTARRTGARNDCRATAITISALTSDLVQFAYTR
jgi:hypothetical protein